MNGLEKISITYLKSVKSMYLHMRMRNNELIK